MTPVATVSNITHDARMNGQRLVAPVMPNDYHRPDNEVPILPRAPETPGESLLSADAVKDLKAQNTKQLLKSNYWYEIASITRWATTGLIGATIVSTISTAIAVATKAIGAAGLTELGVAATQSMSIGQFASLPIATITSSLGAAVFSPWVIGLVAVAAVAAVVTVKASQYSRRTFVEKSFDVQDTLMQRQAKLVGKSVEEAVAPHQDRPTQQSWVERTGAAASLDQAPGQQAAR